MIELESGRPASEDDIQSLETEVGKPLPNDYREFINQFDGASSQNLVFDVPPDNSASIRWFIPVSDVLEQRQFLYLENPEILPVAEVECGNFVVMDLSNDGEILFWDHELHEPLVPIAPSFRSFLTQLKVFDPDSLPDAKVISVWIDPEFKKKLDEN